MNHRKLGWKLAMRVLQSKLYAELDDEERAECDALVYTKRNEIYGEPGACFMQPEPNDPLIRLRPLARTRSVQRLHGRYLPLPPPKTVKTNGPDPSSSPEAASPCS